MSLQVVNPATGEIAAQFADSDFNLAVELCEKLAVPGDRWDVIQINVVHSCDKREQKQI